jgi:hypothetical protein
MMRGSSRGYMVGDTWHIGVTSLIRATLADPAQLGAWKQRKLVDHVLDVVRDARWQGDDGDRPELQAAALIANRESGPAAELGTKVHKVIEDYETGAEVTIDDPALLAYLKQWQRLKDVHTLQVLSTEITLVNTTHRYAGTVDEVVLTDIGPYKRDRFILDVKTGKGVYDTYSLQLALLANCDSYLTAQGELHPIKAGRLPNRDIGLIAKLGPRSGHLYAVDIHAAWRYAEQLIDLYEFQTGAGKALIGDKIEPPVVGLEARRLALLERARTLDAHISKVIKAALSVLPKLTEPEPWIDDLLDHVDELIANAERGGVA